MEWKGPVLGLVLYAPEKKITWVATIELFEAESHVACQMTSGYWICSTFAHFFQDVQRDIKVVFLLYTIL